MTGRSHHLSKRSEMNKLITYVSAIHGLESPVLIVDRSLEQDRWIDQGFEVEIEKTTYHFSNGVVICRSVEQDQFPTELACAECWISYQVIEQNSCCTVSPCAIKFDSTCREAFWIKYHTA